MSNRTWYPAGSLNTESKDFNTSVRCNNGVLTRNSTLSLVVSMFSKRRLPFVAPANMRKACVPPDPNINGSQSQGGDKSGLFPHANPFMLINAPSCRPCWAHVRYNKASGMFTSLQESKVDRDSMNGYHATPTPVAVVQSSGCSPTGREVCICLHSNIPTSYRETREPPGLR